MIAQYMGKYIPGNPAFVVQNMTGGGSMVAANHVYNVAKPDGLTFGLVTPALLIEQLAGRKEVQFDWPKFSWIGSPEKTDRIFYIRTASTPEIRARRRSHPSVAIGSWGGTVQPISQRPAALGQDGICPRTHPGGLQAHPVARCSNGLGAYGQAQYQ